ncbi:hypothetical protein H0H93_016300 [Arthromyces matolae]|nr:hypothetical protein H0H93_016300 [Arthromyces matolae]
MTVGHNLTPETDAISYCYLQDPSRASQRYIFVDTPGFDDYKSRDRDVLDNLVKWFKDSGHFLIRIHIIYLIEINQARQPEDLTRMCPSLLKSGIHPELTIVTTKWRERATNAELMREQEYSEIYSRTPHRFLNNQDSAWDIVRLQPDPPMIHLLTFGSQLDTIIPKPMPKPKRRVFAIFASLFGFKKAAASPDHRDRMETIREIKARLTLAFQDPLQCRALLFCQGPEAQAVLDTFQLILDTGNSNAGNFDPNLRRNLIIGIRKISTRTDLYPTPFYLKRLEQVNDRPQAGGAYGDIYKGVYQGREVCMKLIKIYSTTKPERIAKMIAREAVLWGQMSHRNLLPFYGLYLYNGRLSLISPWASNGTVIDFLRRKPRTNRALLCSDVASGVEYLHTNGIVHGDLKGVNILVDRSERAYIADFGLAAVDDPDVRAWSRNSTESRGGTVRWQAPELFKIETENDAEGPQNTKATDVYAFSCVCYEIFTGFIPFPSDMDGQVILKVLKGDRPALPSASDGHRLGFIDDFRQLVRDCWRENPLERPNIAEIKSRLAPLLPDDNRVQGEWQSQPPPREINSGADVPLTAKMLEKILRGAS